MFYYTGNKLVFVVSLCHDFQNGESSRNLKGHTLLFASVGHYRIAVGHYRVIAPKNDSFEKYNSTAFQNIHNY